LERFISEPKVADLEEWLRAAEESASPGVVINYSQSSGLTPMSTCDSVYYLATSAQPIVQQENNLQANNPLPQLKWKVLDMGRRLTSVALFTRFAAFSFSAVLPLLGAATVAPNLNAEAALRLLGIAITFHIFGYVLNDIVDLPIDRTHPLRQRYPLVMGTISPRVALTIALAQIPLATVLTLQLTTRPLAYVALSSAFSLIAIYDVWGKRSSYPLLMDLIQGIGCCTLVLYGAYTAQDMPNQLTVVICTTVAVYIVLINGVHGSLRDLGNDIVHGVLTTPIFWGVRPSPTGFTVPRRFVAYALCLQVLLGMLIVMPFLIGWLPYRHALLVVTMAAEAVLLGSSYVLLALAMSNLRNPKRLATIGTWHIIVLLSMLLAPLLPMMGSELAITLLVAYLAPLLWTFAPGR
jgi:4-hydroxybenzoate polyprenyltransferase